MIVTNEHPQNTRLSKQCEFCVYLDNSFNKSGLSELFDWSGWPRWSGGSAGSGGSRGSGRSGRSGWSRAQVVRWSGGILSKAQRTQN